MFFFFSPYDSVEIICFNDSKFWWRIDKKLGIVISFVVWNKPVYKFAITQVIFFFFFLSKPFEWATLFRVFAYSYATNDKIFVIYPTWTQSAWSLFFKIIILPKQSNCFGLDKIIPFSLHVKLHFQIQTK